MKITVFESEEWEREIFGELGQNHDIEFSEDKLTEENAEKYSQAEIVSTFIYSDLDKEVLARLENLKMIAARSTGFDHIDLDYCNENGITVCNVPTYGARTVAEHVFGLLLAISHNLISAVDRTRRGDFSMQGLQGFDLNEKTLGVVGTGDIGIRVIEIASGFNMKVLAFDVKPDDELADSLNFKYVSMDELLSESDIITLHVPANKMTHHLIGSEEFGKMKDGSVLINTARGSVVHVESLVKALGSGKIKAAGLDVLPEEPTIREEAELLRNVFREEHNMETLLADHILLRLRNVIITPHSAFNTREAVTRILLTTIENIKNYAKEQPENVVNEPN